MPCVYMTAYCVIVLFLSVAHKSVFGLPLYADMALVRPLVILHVLTYPLLISTLVIAIAKLVVGKWREGLIYLLHGGIQFGSIIASMIVDMETYIYAT